MPQAHDDAPLLTTPLHEVHVALGARLVPFSGYEMPVQYSDGILAEHIWTRTEAGLFDVSHMGQILAVGSDHETTARALETLMPADLVSLRPGQQRYTQILTDDGGILDDLMVTRPADPGMDGKLILVVNAATKEADQAYLAPRLPEGVCLHPQESRALVALQGPKAAAVLARLSPEAAGLAFMRTSPTTVAGVYAHVARSGYTGEDGFEISVSAHEAVRVWEALMAAPEVRPIGLGARDSLRLEAGLCLYGHDIDVTTSPVEAGLEWSVQRRRRAEGGFAGAARVLRELESGPARQRVGLRLEGRAPAREGADIAHRGAVVGKVTSGGFAPTLNAPVAMGYVPPALAVPGTRLDIFVRGKALPALVVPLPFVPHRYARATLARGN